MNKVKLDMNMFTMEFGKIDASMGEHFNKVYKEYNELNNAFDEYDYDIADGWVHPEEEEEDREKLCSEALDMVQASLSFISYLIEEDILTNEDIEKWKEKLENRKKKYLKKGELDERNKV